MGNTRALGLDTWTIPTIGSVMWYSCMYTKVVPCEYSVLSIRV